MSAYIGLHFQTDRRMHSLFWRACHTQGTLLILIVIIMAVVKITHLVMQPSVFKTPVDTFPDLTNLFVYCSR